jgi:zinc protease
MDRRLLVAGLVLCSGCLVGAAFGGRGSEIDIPYEKFVLDNGLTLVVHEDHKAPIVAVNLWYHVGSKNEKPGKTGFAHLFEHLMFNGSEHYNDDYFQAMERIGATSLNGTTSYDRTNYFENVPTSALDVALWMESDRMGHLLGVVTQDKLDEQRGVVQNEKRQYENQPYGLADELIQAACFPKEHPYSWTVIGSMQDLNDASLPDVQEWFKTYYGPNNAVLVIAGDITAPVALEKVKQYFGDIPPGPPVARQQAWIAKRTGTHRQTVQDRVPQARVYRIWNVPPWGTAEVQYLRLVADVLSSGKSSRLYKRLVYDEQIATNVSAYAAQNEIAGLFEITASAKPGVGLSRVEQALDEELQRFLDAGPTKAELTRVKNEFRADFVRRIERVGSGGKAAILATDMVYGGSPDRYKIQLERVAAATAEDLRKTAAAWLGDGDYILEITPFPKLAAAGSGVDRSNLPTPGAPPQPQFPPVQRAQLSNGLKLVLAERHSVPIVNLRLLVDAGYAADQFAMPGAASLAMNLLDEGTRTRSALEISDELQMLGSSLGTGAEVDVCTVSLNTLKDQLDPSLELFADVILHPSFPDREFARLQRETLVRIQQEKMQPFAMAIRVLPGLLYGREHPYGLPLTGSGTEQSVSQMTRGQLADFHRTWFKPNHATLVIAGDITLAEIEPRLEKLFRNWQAGDVPKKDISTVADRSKPEIYLVDRPGSQHSIIFGGFLTLPRADPQEEALQMMNKILGGDFTSRINMNLREDKHWSYGAGSIILPAQGQRMYITYSSVQMDKTADSIAEVQKEFQGITGAKPPTAEEFAKVQANEVLSLPGRWETISSVAGSLEEIVQFNLSDTYWNDYAARITAMKAADVQAAARRVIKPNAVVWVVVGDRTKIEEPLQALGLGPVTYLDADGNRL